MGVGHHATTLAVTQFSHLCCDLDPGLCYKGGWGECVVGPQRRSVDGVVFEVVPQSGITLALTLLSFAYAIQFKYGP